MRFRFWIGIGGLVTSAACSESGGVSVPAPTEREPSASTGLRPDRVAACDGADDGTACGEGARAMHCIFGACVANACGDGFLGGDEACDDGDQVGGDGCSPRCQREECGNGVVDPGEACDDANDDELDSCRMCQSAEAEMVDAAATSDAGASLDAGPKRDCPVSGPILAEPESGLPGAPISLVGVAAGDASYWWNELDAPASNGLQFASPSQLNTNVTCGTVPGEKTVQLLITKAGCLPVLLSATITCIDADAGIPDAAAAFDAASPADAETAQDAGAGLDSAADDAGTLGLLDEPSGLRRQASSGQVSLCVVARGPAPSRCAGPSNRMTHVRIPWHP